MRIDAHHHLWTLSRGDYGWLTPDLAPIYRDFDLSDLAPPDAVAATTPPPATAGAVPDNPDALRQEIEQTREQLGETVERLAAKADMKAQARAKAAALAGRIKGKAAQARATAPSQADNVRRQLRARSAGAREKVAAVAGPAKTQLRTWAARAREATPQPVRQPVAKVAHTARQRLVPLAIAVVTLITGYLAFRWRRNR